MLLDWSGSRSAVTSITVEDRLEPVRVPLCQDRTAVFSAHAASKSAPVAVVRSATGPSKNCAATVMLAGEGETGASGLLGG